MWSTGVRGSSRRRRTTQPPRSAPPVAPPRTRPGTPQLRARRRSVTTGNSYRWATNAIRRYPNAAKESSIDALAIADGRSGERTLSGGVDMRLLQFGSQAIKCALRITIAVFLATFALVASSVAAEAAPLIDSAAGRTITISGYAWCLSSLGASVPAPVVCSSVTLDTSNGYRKTVTPTPGPIGPPESGRFRFTGVPIPGDLDPATITYTVTAEMGSGLTDGQPVRCVNEGSIQGIFFHGPELDLFWTGGPWTALPFSQCSPH
jgi:hypothetical protein